MDEMPLIQQYVQLRSNPESMIQRLSSVAKIRTVPFHTI